MKQEIQYRDVVRAMDLQSEQTGKDVYLVESSQPGKAYHVYKSPEGSWVCECPHHRYRGVHCKHLIAAIGVA